MECPYRVILSSLETKQIFSHVKSIYRQLNDSLATDIHLQNVLQEVPLFIHVFFSDVLG